MKNVHTEHCQASGCKYGELDCPVYLGYLKPSYPEDDLYPERDIKAVQEEKFLQGRKMSPAEALAREFHEAYETLAPYHGYETRRDARVFDPKSRNGQLMIAVCKVILGERYEVPQPVKNAINALRLEVDAGIIDAVENIIQEEWRKKI